MGSSGGATPPGAVLLSVLLALVAIKYVVNRLLAVPTATDLFAKGDSLMKRVKVMLASVLDTVHGLGVSGLASCLLTKDSSAPNYSLKRTNQSLRD